MKIGSDAASKAYHAELAETRRKARERAALAEGASAAPPTPPPAPKYITAPDTSQAVRIVTKLGGPYRLAKVMGRHWTGVYKWLWMPPKGTGGRIPDVAIPKVMEAARLLGITLTAEDWGPPAWEFDPCD